MAGVSGNRDWAVRIAQRVEAGAKLPIFVVDMAASVLGRPILRGGKHAERPDAKDRQAGDDHRYDDMVPL